MRAYELSRELGVTNNQVKIACGEMDKPIKNHMATLDQDLELELREYFATSDIPVKEKKEMTAPWDQSDNPWSLDMLRVNKKRPGFHTRWVNRDNVQRRLDQGYIMASSEHYDGVTDTVVGEEGKDGTLVKRRELVLMELPDELYEKRKKYVDWKTNQRTLAARDMAKKDVGRIEQQGGRSVELRSSFTSKQGH